MRKILIVGMSNTIGGTETYFRNYYKNFDLKKYHFDFITAWGAVAFSDEYEKDGSKIYSVPNFMKNPIGYYRKMRKIIRDNKYDVVHINMLSAANVLPIKAALKEKVSKIIVHSHNTNMPKGIIRKILHNMNKGILARSELTRLACTETAGKWLFGETADFKILNNAIDIERFKFNRNSRDEIRMKYGIKDDEILLGNIGRLCEQKNQLFLVEVMKQLKDEKIRLMIVGDGEQKSSLENAIDKAELSKKIILVPNTINIEKYYSAFDVFVLPSKFEGLPVSAIEAVVNGLSCALSDSIYNHRVFKGQDFLGIDDASNWASLVSTKEVGVRTDNDELVRGCGFDVSLECSKLLEAYDD